MVGTLPAGQLFIVKKDCPRIHETRAEIVNHLPYGATAEVVEVKNGEDSSWRCKVTCPIWVNKEQFIGPAYSKTYSKQEVLSDLAHRIANMFDLMIIRSF